MKLWNVGIVGAGLIGDFHAKAILDVKEANLRGFFDIDFAKAKSLAKLYNCAAYDSLDAMLGDDGIDIITIATPNGTHMEPVVKAAAANKHVLCEKPLEITLDRIDKMIAAHNSAGTQLGCIFQNRFAETNQMLKKAILENRFGKITFCGVSIPWWREQTYYDGSWHGTWIFDGGGALMNQSIHMADLICYFMPPVVEVKSFCGNLAHNMETEDTAVSIMRFANGAFGTIWGTTASYPGQPKRLEISGTGGTVVMIDDKFTLWSFANELEQDLYVRQKLLSTNKSGEGAADPASITQKYHTQNIRSFIKAVANEQKFEIDGCEARKAVKLIWDIYNAAEWGFEKM